MSLPSPKPNQYSDSTAPINEPDEVSIKDVIIKIKSAFRYLSTKRWTIFSFIIIGSLLGLAYAYLKKPIYTATTTFVLEDGEKGGNSLGQYAGLASMVGVDIGGGGGDIFQGDNIMELYKSRKMIQKALLSEANIDGKKFLLIDKYIEFNNLRDKWNDIPELKNIHFDLSEKFTRLQDSVMSKIIEDITKENLVVSKPDKKLSIINVAISAKDEVFAKNFDEEMVKNVNDFYVQTKTKKAIENINILQKQTDSVKNVLNGAIYSTALVNDATPNLNPTKQVLRVQVQRSQYSAESNKVILGEFIKNLELAKLSLRKEAPLIQVIDPPIYPLPKVKASKITITLLGGILGLLLSVTFLSIRQGYRKLMS